MSNEAGSAPRAELDRRIEAIESGYEFLLAYAAQGRDSDRGGGGAGREVREYLGRMEEAVAGLASVVAACAKAKDAQLVSRCAAFVDAIEADASRTEAMIRLVLAQTDISSQLVDNLNASIHLRALLTDLFVADEALKA